MKPEIRLIHKSIGRPQFSAVCIKLEMGSAPEPNVGIKYNKLVSEGKH